MTAITAASPTRHCGPYSTTARSHVLYAVSIFGGARDSSSLRRPAEITVAYNLVGFQTVEDLTAFRDAIVRRAGGKVSSDGYVHAFDRVLRAGAFPIGIDTEAIAELASRAVKSRTARRLQESLRGRQLIIGVDRLDYSKGLEHGSKRSPAFSRAIPHTAPMSACCRLPPRRAATGDVAGRFAELDWAPIQYLNRSFPSARSLASFGSAAWLLSLRCATE